jgi:hypothetical protein
MEEYYQPGEGKSREMPFTNVKKEIPENVLRRAMILDSLEDARGHIDYAREHPYEADCSIRRALISLGEVLVQMGNLERNSDAKSSEFYSRMHEEFLILNEHLRMCGLSYGARFALNLGKSCEERLEHRVN